MNLPYQLKKLWPSRIRSQLILSLTVIHVVLMSVFIFVLVDRQKAFLLKINQERAYGNSINLANVAVSYLYSNELEGLGQVVSKYQQTPGLQYAMILSKEQTVLAHTNKNYIGLKATDSISRKLTLIPTTQTLLNNNAIIDIATPILRGEEIVGWARIGMSQKDIGSNIRGIKKRGLLYILVSLIVGCIAAVIIADRLSKGLYKLVSAAEKIQQGDRGVRVGSSNSLEITRLGTAFNKMLDDISQNEKLLSLVLENMPVGVWLVDADGKIVSSNNAGREIWLGAASVGLENYSRYNDWLTDTIMKLKSEQWGLSVALHEGKPVLNQEMEIDCFDKSKKIILNSAIALRDAKEKIIGAIAINVDITDRKLAELNLRKINHTIGERVKELNCLSILSGLLTDTSRPIEHILEDCVHVIPSAYQFPEITCAQIEYEGKIFASKNFCESIWKQEEDIVIKDKVIGKVQVFYHREMPPEDEGPFLKEERLLLNSIADMIASASERSQAEQIIKYQAESFEAIIENTNESILLIAPDLRVLQFNKTAAKRLFKNGGLQIYKGADFNKFLYAGTEDTFHNTFSKALHGEYSEVDIKHTGITGDTFWLRSRFYPVADASGTLMGVTLLSEDISDRKRSESELKESEEKFRNLVELTPLGVFIVQDQKIVYANPGFENMSGYSRNELVGRMSFDELIYAEDAGWLQENYQRRLVGEPVSNEYMLQAVRKDGERIYVDVIVSNIVYNNKPAVIGSVVDKTRHVEEEKRVGRAVIDAQEKERTEIGMELHDNVKQIMAASLMNLDFIKKNLHNTDECIDIIQNVKGYILEAINELRRLSHQLAPSIEEDTGTLEEKINKLIYDSKITDKVEMLVDIQQFDIPINAEIQLAVYRILQEQLNNIIKYAKASSVSIRIKQRDGLLNLTIDDDGVGFDVKSSRGGIGLENVKRRVSALDGTVSIISSPGEGCRLQVKVPVN